MTIKLACERFIANIDAINAKCAGDIAALDAQREAAIAAHRSHIRRRCNLVNKIIRCALARGEIDRAVILAERTERYREVRY
jgi:hypothetical protein